MSINTLSPNSPLSEPAAQGAELELGKESFKIPENWTIVNAPKMIACLPKADFTTSSELSGKFIAYAEQFIGKGILDNDGHYSQILPFNVYKNAAWEFDALNKDYQKSYIELLNKYSSDLIATSTIFAIIAYGNKFAESLVSSTNNIKNLQYSLDNSRTFFENRLNFQQNYLNTCVAVSNFSALSDLLHNNIFVLNKIIEFELGKIKTEVEDIENNKHDTVNPLDKRAYNTVNPIAPTIRNEIAKHIKQCENKVNNVNDFFGNSEKVLNRKILIKYQNGLVEAFERMAAIQDPLKPVLISKRFFQSFILSCIIDVILIFLAKIFTFGLYTGSAKLSERTEGVQPIRNNTISALKPPSYNFNEFDIDFWWEIYNSGIALTAKDLGICKHCIAIKACIDTNGKKYFEIHDPLEKNFSRVYIFQDNVKNIVTNSSNMV